MKQPIAPFVQDASALIPGTSLPCVELHPVDGTHAHIIDGWFRDERARHWLDLGSGRQQMPARELLLMLIGPRCHARLFRLPGSAVFLGLVCLNDFRNEMGSAEVWGLRGFYGRTVPNVTAAAFLSVVAEGFLHLGREVIGSWVVEGNAFSISMLEKLGMRCTGRQRARHRINGRLHDRLLFDVTRQEFAAAYPLIASASQLGAVGRTLAPVARERQA